MIMINEPLTRAVACEHTSSNPTSLQVKDLTGDGHTKPNILKEVLLGLWTCRERVAPTSRPQIHAKGTFFIRRFLHSLLVGSLLRGSAGNPPPKALKTRSFVTRY